MRYVLLSAALPRQLDSPRTRLLLALGQGDTRPLQDGKRERYQLWVITTERDPVTETGPSTGTATGTATGTFAGTSPGTTLIFQLGTNNWQRQGEFAPGSGILHEAHHRALNQRPDTEAYSIYPSRRQRFTDSHVRVFELDHDIPICESISPVSSYRWHSFSDDEFAAYRKRLADEAEEWINQIEREHGKAIDLLVAHHTFLNPLVAGDLNRRRLDSGRQRIPVLCFVHGTALKMYNAELDGVAAEEAGGEPDEEFPFRFLPLMRSSGVFNPDDSETAVDWCAAISNQQVDAFSAVFDTFPADRIALSPNGYNEAFFKPAAAPAEVAGWRADVLPGFATEPYEGSPLPSAPVPGDYDKVVVFCGKFAAWKRLDALLRAAAIWEADETHGKVGLIVVGSGPLKDQRHYHELAHTELGLQNVHFVGPKSQDDLATLFSAADVACFPSKNEPFGLVFIEAMACGTPVIGVNSGGPKDFVIDQVGTLVPETDDIEVLASNLAAAVKQALTEDWKSTKGPEATAYAEANFSVRQQVDTLLADTLYSNAVFADPQVADNAGVPNTGSARASDPSAQVSN